MKVACTVRRCALVPESLHGTTVYSSVRTLHIGMLCAATGSISSHVIFYRAESSNNVRDRPYSLLRSPLCQHLFGPGVGTCQHLFGARCWPSVK